MRQSSRERKQNLRKVIRSRTADTDFCLAKQASADEKADPNKEGDDLEMIGGTTEDDFSEAIALIR